MEEEYKLIRGDCLEILPTLKDMCVDAIITDLPYGTTACSWDVVIPFKPMWKQVKRLCKGAFVTTTSQPFTSLLVASSFEMYRDEWIWEKDRATRHLDANRRPLKAHENVIVFSRNGYTYNPQKTKGHRPVHNPGKRRSDNLEQLIRSGLSTEPNNYGQTDRYPRTIQKFNMPNGDERGLHPTQKPVALYEYLIKTYTNPGDTVLDFCMGSGTTGVAAIKTGRKFIGIELHKKYFDIAGKRIGKTIFQEPLFPESMFTQKEPKGKNMELF